jgi:LPS sulfotransferase NodH
MLAMVNWWKDPHETRERLPPFRRDRAIDEYLGRLNQILQDVELPRLNGDGPDSESLPMIYVVGAPRSGGTLLAQVLSRHLRVGYISNLAARFWLRPSIGVSLARSFDGGQGHRRISFESAYGRTAGVEDVNEFGYFWRHWLRLDVCRTHHLSAGETTRIDSAGLTRALRQEILQPFGLPVVMKNIICGMHAEFLSRLHPRSVFVRIERSPYDVAASMLRARHTIYGDYDAWWSVKPSTYPFAPPAESAEEEVVRQLSDWRRELKAELSKPGVSVIDVGYDDLCADPHGMLDGVVDRVRRTGYDLKTRDLDGLSPFAKHATTALPADRARRLRTWINKYFP